MENILFDKLEIEEVFDKMNTKKASNDPIPNILLKIVGSLCSTHILNKVIESKTWPKMWKIADIVPLAKDKIPDYNNVRPISILSSFNKCLEQLLKKRIMPFYIKHINQTQFGFIPMGSTSSALIAILDKIFSLLDNKSIIAVSMISFDMKKAFDKVNHQLLLDKLSDFIPSTFCEILASYFFSQQQRVKVNTWYNDFCDIDFGEPQGSVLSPILFGFFMNDSLYCHTLFFFKIR